MIDGIEPAPNQGEDKGAASDARPRPCTRRTWCTLPEHATNVPCSEVPRYPIAPSDFGPKAASSTRRGK